MLNKLIFFPVKIQEPKMVIQRQVPQHQVIIIVDIATHWNQKIGTKKNNLASMNRSYF